MVFLIFLFLVFFVFFTNSFHSLVFLLLLELVFLYCFLGLFMGYYCWFSFLMFLLVGVCLSSFGLSVLVSMSREKGFSYFLSF